MLDIRRKLYIYTRHQHCWYRTSHALRNLGEGGICGRFLRSRNCGPTWSSWRPHWTLRFHSRRDQQPLASLSILRHASSGSASAEPERPQMERTVDLTPVFAERGCCARATLARHPQFLAAQGGADISAVPEDLPQFPFSVGWRRTTSCFSVER